MLCILLTIQRFQIFHFWNGSLFKKLFKAFSSQIFPKDADTYKDTFSAWNDYLENSSRINENIEIVKKQLSNHCR